MTILPANGDQAVVRLSRIATIDLEASGLGSADYPVEIGWCLLYDDGSITSGAILIRPAAKWTLYKNAWSPASERLTGITRAMVDQDGVSPREAMARFLDAVGDRDLYSDEVDFDRHWIEMLADAAGMSIDGLEIGDARKLMDETRSSHPETGEAPRHRAEADARRLASSLAYSTAADTANATVLPEP